MPNLPKVKKKWIENLIPLHTVGEITKLYN